jgi:hypothetical protein
VRGEGPPGNGPGITGPRCFLPLPELRRTGKTFSSKGERAPLTGNIDPEPVNPRPENLTPTLSHRPHLPRERAPPPYAGATVFIPEALTAKACGLRDLRHFAGLRDISGLSHSWSRLVAIANIALGSTSSSTHLTSHALSPLCRRERNLDAIPGTFDCPPAIQAMILLCLNVEGHDLFFYRTPCGDCPKREHQYQR